MKRARKVRYVFPEMNEFSGHAHDIYGSGIPQEDLNLIKVCDGIVAFIDSPDRIGTFCEIAAAYVLGKAIYIVSINRKTEMYMQFDDDVPWFVNELTTKTDSVMLDPSNEMDLETYAKDELEAEKQAIDLIVKMLGGDNIDYYEYIKSTAWKEKADAAKERAGNRCQVCNKAGRLDAHHRTYERLGDELPEDITVLCRECHEVYEMNRKAKAKK